MKWDLDETFLLNGGRPSLWQCPRPELFVKTKVTLPLFFGSIVQDFLHWYTEKKLLFLIRITIIAIYNDKFLKKSLPRLKHEVGLRVHTQLPVWNWIKNIIVKNFVNILWILLKRIWIFWFMCENVSSLCCKKRIKNPDEFLFFYISSQYEKKN